MARLVKQISPLIPSQFPAFYRENAPHLVDFVQTFYQWMETQGPLYHSRRIFDYQDIDTTTTNFLIHFRKKNTPDIQLETAFNPRLLVKHALDLYRARGTPPAIDLFFRLVFGVGATVFLPKKHLFRSSDGVWTEPIYLEVTPTKTLKQFVGREIIGYTSGATAFCERYVEKLNSNNEYVNILFLSEITGDFVIGEILNIKLAPLQPAACPQILGSLTGLTVEDGSEGYLVGDSVAITGGSGSGALAKVTAIASTAGKVTPFLANKGYGFTANAQVLVSQQLLLLSNVIPYSNNDTRWYFEPFDTISQPTANLNYKTATGTFLTNTNIFTYFANTTQKGVGYVLSINQTNSTAGNLTIAVLSGNMNDNTIYTTGNTISANETAYINTTATGNVFATGDNVSILISNGSGFIPGELVFQGNSTGIINQIIPSPATLQLRDRGGFFYSNKPITGLASGAMANVISSSLLVGLINVSGTFLVDNRAPCVTQTSISSGIISASYGGSGASFNISGLQLTENVIVNNDYVRDYLNVRLNTTYGFPAFPTANTTTILQTAFANLTITIGQIASLVNVNPGSNYTQLPFIRIFEPYTFPYRVVDYITTITGATAASFTNGEEIIQTATGARAIFNSSFSIGTTLSFRRANLFVNLVPTINSTTTIVGQLSGTVANVVTVSPDYNYHPFNINETDLGFNANVMAVGTTQNGTVVSLLPLDSGFGYHSGDIVNFSKDGAIPGQAQVILGNPGQGNGYYLDPGTQLSDDSHLNDNYYWQEFSYEVRSPIPVPAYQDMQEKLLHVAGTRFFGAVYSISQSNAVASVQSAIISLSNVVPQLDFSEANNSQYLPLIF